MVASVADLGIPVLAGMVTVPHTTITYHSKVHYTTGLGLLLYPVTAEYEVISGPRP